MHTHVFVVVVHHISQNYMWATIIELSICWSFDPSYMALYSGKFFKAKAIV